MLTIESLIASEGLKQGLNVTKNIATGIVQATPYIIQGASTIYQKIYDRNNKYNEQQIRDLQLVRFGYKEYCYPIEVKAKGTTTLTCHGEFQQTVETDFPVFFQVKDDRPILLSEGLYPVADSSYWSKKLNGELRNKIHPIISYICQYIKNRSVRIIEHYYKIRWAKDLLGGSLYDYDPINMFFEEMKFFLYCLSNTKADENLIPMINGRIKYIDNIFNSLCEKDVFDDKFSKFNSVNAAMLIDKIRSFLENEVKPFANQTIASTAAREKFYTIRSTVEDTLKDGMEFLLFVFQGSPNIPDTFILEEILRPTLSSYQHTNSTEAGKLLRYLGNAETMQRIFKCQYSEKKSILNQSEIETKRWFLNGLIPSGVIKEFEEEKLLQRFISMHSSLYRLSQFYFVCNSLYGLSGDGGNLLVYGKAAVTVTTAMSCCTKLLAKIKEDATYLFGIAKKYQADNIIKSRSHLVTPVEIEPWLKNFKKLDYVYKNFMENIESIQIKIEEITWLTKNFNTAENISRIIQEIEHLEKLVESFSLSSKHEKELNQKICSNSHVTKLVNSQYKNIEFFMKNGKSNEALQIVEKFEKTMPDNVETTFLKTKLLFQEKKFKETIDYCSKIIQIEKCYEFKTPYALLLKAISFYEINDIKQCQIIIEECVSYLDSHCFEDAYFDEKLKLLINRCQEAEIKKMNKEVKENNEEQGIDSNLTSNSFFK